MYLVIRPNSVLLRDANVIGYPSTGSNMYQNVDEAIPSATDYNYVNTTSYQRVIYGFTAPSSTVGRILSISISSYLQLSGVLTSGAKAKHCIRFGTAYYFGSEYTPTTSASLYYWKMTTRPDNGARWQWSDVASIAAGLAQVGFNSGKAIMSAMEISTYILIEVETSTVSTKGVGNISSSGFFIAGEIIENPTDTIYERGFCYRQSDEGTPNVDDDKTIKETGVFGVGVYGLWVDGLEDKTDYRVSAYIKDESGAYYGDVLDVYTDAAWQPDFDSKLSLKPFIFAKNDAYVLEFGDRYIRFIKNREYLVKTYATWLTATDYLPGDLVINSENYYRCIVSHKSASFATELGLGYWEITEGATDTTYEIRTVYAAADVSTITQTQSADVMYLFHEKYPPQKLMRLPNNVWHIEAVPFRPPGLVVSYEYPEVTLTPDATEGDGVSFTAGGAVFLSGDIGREIRYRTGRAIITAFVSSTEVICSIISSFLNTAAIASGLWKFIGSRQGSLLPSASEPVNGLITLTVDDGDSKGQTWVSITLGTGDNWELSGSGTAEYYLKNSASCYTAAEPAFVRNQNGTVYTKKSLGSLTSVSWGWGDNDSLGYNTIYIRYGTSDPDSLAKNTLQRSAAAGNADVFTTADVGKYLRIYDGLIKITGINDVKSVAGIILRELDPVIKDDTIQPISTWTLYQEAWPSSYPVCGGFYQDRLCVGVGESIFFSMTGDYENFSPGINDDDAFVATLGGRSVNKIVWLEQREYLTVGTEGGEWIVAAEGTEKILTPLNAKGRRMTNYGCAPIQPVPVRNNTLFVQAAVRKIRELTNNPASVDVEYLAPDLTQLGEHITSGLIAGICYQQEPMSLVWMWMENGDIASLTYLRDEDVFGISRHLISGEAESMCVIPSNGYDEVYCAVKRIIDNENVKTVEYLTQVYREGNADFVLNSGRDAFFVDCGITYDGEAATVIDVPHLKGETVAILADGAVAKQQVVDENGQITLSTPAHVVHTGLPYTGKIVTLRPDYMLNDGTAQGKVKRIVGIIMRVLDSATFKAGRDNVNIDEYGFATYDRALYETLFRDSDLPTGRAVTLFTGDKHLVFDGDFNREGQITIIQDKPLPLTIVAIIAELDT